MLNHAQWRKSQAMDLEDRIWKAYRERISTEYDNLNYSSKLQRLMMAESHKIAEQPFDAKTNYDYVLEVGAGTGEHFQFVRHGYKQYMMTDADSKALDIAKRKYSENNNNRINYEKQNAEKLSYPDNTFDRCWCVERYR